jgi:hypothetical protein
LTFTATVVKHSPLLNHFARKSLLTMNSQSQKLPDWRDHQIDVWYRSLMNSLPDDLALQLDRNGDRPLSVENPKTHRLYYIVAAEEYGPIQQPLDDPSPRVKWTDERSTRRFQLIDKQITISLSSEEIRELDFLEQQMDVYLRRPVRGRANPASEGRVKIGH